MHTHLCVYEYSYVYTRLSVKPCSLKFYVYSFMLSLYIAFSQPASGPSSVCEGSTNVTLQCRIVFNGFSRDSVWYRNGTSVRVGNDFIPNHNVIFNSTTGASTDLMITDVTLGDDNTVYTCTSTDNSITSSVVLNVSGKLCACNVVT